MKKIHIILVLLFAFAVVTCTSGVASALYPKYVGNTSVDLERSGYSREDFSCCGKPLIQRNPPETG